MPFPSIRARVTFLSIAFGVVLIGLLTIASYFLIGSGMARAAEQSTADLADAARVFVDQRVVQATAEASAQGLVGDAADAYVAEAVLGSAPEAITYGLVYDGFFALYYVERPDGPVQLAWSSPSGIEAGSADAREAAIDSSETVNDFPRRLPSLTGMVVSADMGTYVSHVAVNVPGTAGAVLDVSYVPHREAAVFDAVRGPMLAVALVALAISYILTKTITGWALSLVGNLREAADSIDVGKLDVHLPAEGKNEVAELARSLNGLIDTLRRGHDVQTRFIADASHELATPVAGIRGYVNILREWGAEDPSLRTEAIDAIDRESRRMARLCHDLLSFIRSEETIEYRNVRYDINAVCREVLAGAATRYLDKDLKFIGPEEESLWLKGDPERIEEALGILVDNACKYTPLGGRVMVNTRKLHDKIVVEVVDTGIGIPENDLPNIFERFYRSDASRSHESGGFGLGLPIAKHIIDASGGSISVQSRLGLGTTFEVVLPKHKGD